MARPTSKVELLEAMAREHTALMGEIEDVSDTDRVVAGACEHWSIKDLLGHLDAWHEMFLTWEAAGSAREVVPMPAPGFGWKDTPELNDQIYQRIKDDPYAEVEARFADSYERVRAVVAGYSDEDLATKRRFAWTGSTSVLSYSVSATSSHYDWARKHIRKFKKNL